MSHRGYCNTGCYDGCCDAYARNECFTDCGYGNCDPCCGPYNNNCDPCCGPYNNNCDPCCGPYNNNCGPCYGKLPGGYYPNCGYGGSSGLGYSGYCYPGNYCNQYTLPGPCGGCYSLTYSVDSVVASDLGNNVTRFTYTVTITNVGITIRSAPLKIRANGSGSTSCYPLINLCCGGTSTVTYVTTANTTTQPQLCVFVEICGKCLYVCGNTCPPCPTQAVQAVMGQQEISQVPDIVEITLTITNPLTTQITNVTGDFPIPPDAINITPGAGFSDVGGVTLRIEAATIPASGNLVLTATYEPQIAGSYQWEATITSDQTTPLSISYTYNNP